MNESQLQDQIRLVLGADHALVLWRNNCGSAQMRNGGTVRFGVGSPGGSDLLGIFRGVFVAVEVKTPTGRVSPEQRLFGELVTKRGGVYVVVRSTEDATAWLAEMHRRFPAQEAA